MWQGLQHAPVVDDTAWPSSCTIAHWQLALDSVGAGQQLLGSLVDTPERVLLHSTQKHRYLIVAGARPGGGGAGGRRPAARGGAGAGAGGGAGGGGAGGGGA